MPLLADPDFTVAKAYDAYSGLSKTAKRAVIIVDERGRVAYRHDHALGLDFQTVADLKETLDDAAGAASGRGRALRIPARFNGPPGSANGGYTCGLVAGALGAASARGEPSRARRRSSASSRWSARTAAWWCATARRWSPGAAPPSWTSSPT